jgi:hypothetical protein
MKRCSRARLGGSPKFQFCFSGPIKVFKQSDLALRVNYFKAWSNETDSFRGGDSPGSGGRREPRDREHRHIAERDDKDAIVPLLTMYPVLVALAGGAAASLLTQRAFALMNAEGKAALLDAASSTRLLNIIALAVFLGLVLWRPPFGWVFLGCAYLGLGVRSIFRLRRLELPPLAARLIIMANASAVLGIVICASVFAIRSME